MKATIEVVKVLVVVGVLFLLSHRPNKIQAQQWQGSQCVTFYTETDPCPSCCTNPGGQITDDIQYLVSSTGIQSDYLSTFDCGEPIAGGCSVECSGQYDEGEDDPTCCGSNGAYCENDYDCCTGLLCSENTCSWCRANGGSCQDGSQCCSGLCDSGTYTCVACLTEFEYCQYDSDCCTGVCQYGFCSGT